MSKKCASTSIIIAGCFYMPLIVNLFNQYVNAVRESREIVKNKHVFLLYFSVNYRDFSVKSKLIISLFQTVKLSLSISLFQKKIGFS